MKLVTDLGFHVTGEIVAEQRRRLRKLMMGLLARREHSKLELYQKMRVKGFDKEMIQFNVDEFAQSDWQSNQRYCEMILRSRVIKKHGPVKIKMELRQKGVSDIDIERCFDRSENEQIDWVMLCQSAWKKKYRGIAQSQNEKAQQYRFLQQRGFTVDQIKSALKGKII